MFLKKAGFNAVFLAGFLILATSPVYAQASSQSGDFANQAVSDAQAIGNFLNAPFSHSMGFISSLGWDNPPGIFDFLAGPRVEVGFGLGADLINLPNLSGLNLPALTANSNVSLPTFLPFPYPFGTARVGLANGLDVGFKVSYMPQISLPIASLSANYTGLGIDFRYKFLSGATLPDVTVGTSLDTFGGRISLSTNVNQVTNYEGAPATFTGTTGYALVWKVQSFGARVLVGKDLGVIYPFASVGFQRSAGSVSSNVNVNGTVAAGGGSSTLNFVTISEAPPVVLEPKFVAGIDVGEGFHWGLVGESNGTDIAANTSFRVQF